MAQNYASFELGEWRAHLEQAVDVPGWILYLFKMEGGHRVFLTKSGEQMVAQEGIAPARSDIYFAHFEDASQLAAIGEVISEAGFKPQNQHFLEGELNATKKHLDDMRQMANALIKKVL